MSTDDSVAGAPQVIEEDRCRQLLSSTRVGRLAYVVDGRPRLVVLNHLPDGDDLLFQTNEESALAGLTDGGASLPVCVEVDSSSASGHVGWSVIVTGSLARQSDPLPSRLPEPWRGDAVGVVLRLSVDGITGRSVGS